MINHWLDVKRLRVDFPTGIRVRATSGVMTKKTGEVIDYDAGYVVVGYPGVIGLHYFSPCDLEVVR